METFAIRETTWERLVRAGTASVEAGWASPGVFATAIGPDYVPGAPDSVFYVGKSAGPRDGEVGLSHDQAASSAATATWMLSGRNSSDFWGFADRIARREALAWSNLAKIDRAGKKPPTDGQWGGISEVCLEALNEEFEALSPSKIVLATLNFQPESVLQCLGEWGFLESDSQLPGGESRVFVDSRDRLAVIARHAQGWGGGPRDQLARFIRDWGRPAAA